VSDKILQSIEICDNPKLLRQWIKNGLRENNVAVAMAARRRLYTILPSAEHGALEFDVWASIHALEELEGERRGKTVRLQRTRNMIREIGECACVERLLLKPTVSTGFDMLLDYGLPNLLFEAVALRHPSQFSEAALAKARERMALADQRVGTGSAPE
jgi:hypothetical protein